MEEKDGFPFQCALDQRCEFLQGRDDRSEGNTVAQPSQRKLGRQVVIAPILKSQVEELEKQPNWDRDKCDKHKIPWGIKERGRSAFPEIKAVQDNNKRPPGTDIKPRLHEGDIEDEKDDGQKQRSQADVHIQPENFFHPSSQAGKIRLNSRHILARILSQYPLHMWFCAVPGIGIERSGQQVRTW